ncbi:class I SAM-dependent methyltransferase [Paenibacillus sp. FSL R7-0204]|uniref:class I SAM-dependent methyltransferase n=1 Tax=Paenibacillus sp. FSL R7-0204 TaxID=2921675 RepID=UPI0030F7F103
MQDQKEMLEINKAGWDEVADQYFGIHALPQYGPYAPTEDELHLLGDVTGKTVLEIGCGSGHSLLYMANRGAGDIWGIDLSTTQVNYAKELLQENRLTGNIQQMSMENIDDLPSEYFDIVFSVYALGWTVDMARTLSNIYKRLKNGGVLVFSWEHPIQSRLMYEDDKITYTQSYHSEGPYKVTWRGVPVIMHHRKVSTILNELSNAGFFIERVIEESRVPETDESSPTTWYSGMKARLSPPTIIIKCIKK